MVQVEEQIVDEGVEIIWVLEQDMFFLPGRAATCQAFVRGEGSQHGLCVGDGETIPQAGVFNDSPFASGRGFDMLVRLSDMRVVFHTDHGSGPENDNLSGDAVLAAIRAQIEEDGMN